jgi:hypothetical protein
MPGTLGETFFRPDELARERLTLPAVLYNQCRLVLARCEYEHVFVPVRTMQIQAVIDRAEVIFVDSQAYAVQEGTGGKLICLAWVFRHEVGRDELSGPAPIELVYYREDSRQLHDRLVGEFMRALEQYASRSREARDRPRAGKVLPLRR